MKKILIMSAAHPWFVLLFLCAGSLVAIGQLGDLEINVSPQALSIENDPAKELYLNHLKEFGSDNITLIYIQDDDLFEYEKLETLRLVIRQLEQLPFVDKTESLFSIPYVRVIDDTVYTSPYLEKTPHNKEQAQELITLALKNPLVRNNLLSTDGKALAINVYLSHHEHGADFNSEVSIPIEEILAPLKSQFKQSFQLGAPYVRDRISQSILADFKLLVPISILVLFISLLLAQRSIRSALLPLITASLSVLWTLAVMAFMGIPLTVMTVIVPVLIIIIGSTEDIHLISEFHTGIAKGFSRKRAMFYMARRMGLAILLTFFTSYLGFLSIAVNPIQMMKEFGLVASSGLAVNFLMTILLVPVYLRYVGLTRVKHKKNSNSSRVVQLSNFVMNHKSGLLSFSLILLILCAYGAMSLQVNNNIMDYFENGSAVKQRASIVQTNLAGMETFSIVLDSSIEGTFQKLRYLDEVIELQEYLNRSDQFDSSLSLVDYLSVLNSSVNDTGDIEVPEDDEVLTSLTTLVDFKTIKAYVSEDFSKTRIHVRHHMQSSNDVQQALLTLQDFINNNIDAGLKISITGESILSIKTSDYMALGQVKSLGLMIMSILIVITLLIGNVKAGLLATLPSLFPIVVLFGVMGFFGIALDTATSMIAAIALGISIDNTMHFMVRYRHRLGQLKNEEESIRQTLIEEFRPITVVTLALAFGIGVLFFSSFKPVALFGLLSSLVILLAYYANFFITPVLLSTTRLISFWDLNSFQSKRELKRDCPLFMGLSDWQIKRVILMGQVFDYKAGQLIFSRQEVSDNIFIILKGEAVISDYRQGINNLQVNMSAGDVIGVISTAKTPDENYKVLATEDCQVLAIGADNIFRKAAIYPHLVIKILLNLYQMNQQYQTNDCFNSTPTGTLSNYIQTNDGKTWLSFSEKQNRSGGLEMKALN